LGSHSHLGVMSTSLRFTALAMMTQGSQYTPFTVGI
jgi:hypothetical protein